MSLPVPTEYLWNKALNVSRLTQPLDIELATREGT
jgi:hypothetical protein